MADSGTLFLDEIGDMDIEVQTQLLKTIEERSFRRIGENRLRHSDFRLICATNRDLLKDTESGRFRKDLYYRICVYPIELPPLRTRLGGHPRSYRTYPDGFGYTELPIAAGILNAFSRYSWPGNVRELRNLLERALLFSRKKPLELGHFTGLTIAAETGTTTPLADEVDDLEKFLDAQVQRVLKKHGEQEQGKQSPRYFALSALPQARKKEPD